MKFTFTEDQTDFAAAVADLLSNEATPAVLRKAWESDTGRAPALWNQLSEMGVVAMLVPEADGGLGMADLDMVLINYEAGRVALSEPLAVVASVVAPTLAEVIAGGGSALGDRAAELLSGIAAGEASVALVVEPESSVSVVVVEGAFSADAILIQSGSELHLVDTSSLSLTPRQSTDESRKMSSFEFAPSAETLLTTDAAVADRCADRAAVASAAQLCGLAQTMLDMTVEYATERKQFGVAIGTFQAIKHHLADALLALEFAKPLAWRAAYSLSHNDPQASVHASMAKAQATDAAILVAEKALQCHGAIAYTVEYDLHMFMKRAWALAAAGGDARYHRAKIAPHILR